MKKKLLVSLLTLVAGISLAACNNTSNSEKPTVPAKDSAKQDEPLTLSKLQIVNKDSFMDYFYVGDGNKLIDLAVDDGKNASTLFNQKKITVTTSNANVAQVIGRYVSPVGQGEVTITVSGGGKTDSVTFYVGKKITLVPEDTEVGVGLERDIAVDGEDKNAENYNWITSDPTKATVENGKVKGVASGRVTIEAKLKSNEKEGAKIEILVAKNVAIPVEIKTLKKDITATVRGEIIAKAAAYFFIDDGTAVVEVYSSTNFKIGDTVKVTGSVKAYGNVLEFDSKGLTVVKIGYKVPKLFGKEPVELTAEIAKTVLAAKTDGSSNKDVRKFYKWSATATKSGNFDCFNIDGVDGLLEIKNYTDFTFVTGNYYDVEGIWMGGGTSSGKKYANFFRTKVTESVPPKTVIHVSNTALTFDVGNTRQLSATYMLSKADQDKGVNSITWTSSDDTKATVDANGLVTAKAEGTAKITCTVGESSVEVDLTVVAAHAVKKINALNTNEEKVRVKAVVSSVNTKGAILSDETGSIYAEFDSKHAPTLKANDYIEVIAPLSVHKGIISFYKLNSSQTYVFSAKAEGKPNVSLGVATEWTKEKGNSYVKAYNKDETADATPVSEVKLYTWKTTVTTDDKNNLVLALDGAEASDAKNIAYTSIPTIEVGNRYTVTGFFIGFDWGYEANKFFITSASEITQTRIKFASDYYANGVTVNTGLSSELEYKFTVSDADSVGLTGSDYVNMVSFTSSDETIVKAEKTSSEPDTAGNSKSRLKLTGIKAGSAKVTAKITAPAKDGKEAKVLFSKDIAVTVAVPASYSKISSTADIKANDEVLLTFSNGGKTYAFAAETLAKDWYLKAEEVAVSDNKITDVKGASVLTLEAGTVADSYYFHADNGKYLNSAVKTDEKGTHYNTLIANKKDAATSLFSVSFDDKGVLTVKNTNGVFVTGTVFKGTAEFQGAASNNANYPLAIYKKA